MMSSGSEIGTPLRGAGEKSHYDVLDVETTASLADIERAYARALNLVDGTAIGGYLMLDPESAASARRELDEARRVLTDGALRRAYDESLGLPPPTPAPHASPPSAAPPTRSSSSMTPRPTATLRILAPVVEPAPAPVAVAKPMVERAERASPTTEVAPPTAPPRTSSLPRFAAPVVVEDAGPPASATEHTPSAPASAPATPAPVSAPATPASAAEGVGVPRPISSSPGRADEEEPKAATLAPEEEINGALLRRLREARGIDLATLAHETHIRRAYLEAMEAMQWEELPPRVFLRGFLTQIARVYRVDPVRLADGYLKLVERFKKR